MPTARLLRKDSDCRHRTCPSSSALLSRHRSPCPRHRGSFFLGRPRAASPKWSRDSTGRSPLSSISPRLGGLSVDPSQEISSEGGFDFRWLGPVVPVSTGTPGQARNQGSFQGLAALSNPASRLICRFETVWRLPVSRRYSVFRVVFVAQGSHMVLCGRSAPIFLTCRKAETVTSKVAQPQEEKYPGNANNEYWMSWLPNCQISLWLRCFTPPNSLHGPYWDTAALVGGHKLAGFLALCFSRLSFE
ncbi:uncharacterized protein BJX67DRAFT_269057 [Aspergillus lucknowensis]|uniref:Uncharacterized protein n=1 Tax=Aspergillus lucknowensis TaxID=176173 RepID=A0ABR4LI40_9EURO